MRNVISVVAFIATLASIGGATAQVYPSRPITMIAPTGAGSSTDAIGRIVAEQPGLVRAWNRLGTVWHTMGRIEEGINAYRRAIALRPSYAAAHCNLGKAMQDLDRPDEAIAAFKKNRIHDVLAVCAELRPSVDIAVS